MPRGAWKRQSLTPAVQIQVSRLPAAFASAGLALLGSQMSAVVAEEAVLEGQLSPGLRSSSSNVVPWRVGVFLQCLV